MTRGAQSPETRHKARGTRARAWTALAFLGGALIGAVLVAASQIIPEEPPEVWPELAKAGVQIGLVGLAASGVTWLLGRATEARDEARRIEAYRLRIFGEIVDAYNGIKAVRRTLRALGFRNPCGTGRLLTKQADEFLAEMRSLVTCQLALEHIKRELETRAGAFPEEEYLRTRVTSVEEHLNEVISDWEKKGPTIVEGADVALVRDLKPLQKFLGPGKESFRPNVTTPMTEVQTWLTNDVYGRSTDHGRSLGLRTAGSGPGRRR
jgi:hypothetical protein